MITDNTEKEGLHAIGTLARLVKISTDTLRYYDEIGLVKPAYISEQSGYRYYSDEQAKRITQIIELKQYGFSLDEIKRILEEGDKPLDLWYRQQYTKVIHEIRRLQNAAEQLEKKCIQNKGDMLMSKRILLVDDAAFMRMMCKDIFQRAGYVIAGEATDGEKAICLYDKLKADRMEPDIVVMNITMPLMDGINATKGIITIHTAAKIVMCSALCRTHIVAEALLAGAQDFVIKPFTPEKLLSVVGNALLTTKAFDEAVLRHMRERSLHDTRFLSQEEVDGLVLLASSKQVTAVDAEVWLHDTQTYTKETTEEALPDELRNASTHVMLQKILDGQEEIKALLKQETALRNN